MADEYHNGPVGPFRSKSDMAVVVSVLYAVELAAATYGAGRTFWRWLHGATDDWGCVEPHALVTLQSLTRS